MLSIKTSLCSILLLASSAAAATQSSIDLQVEYCSTENTGVSNDQGTNVYQTLGLCNNNCEGKFAYAVLQYQGCWCSNEKPTETVSVDKCNQICPGYPDEKCGNKSAGLYSYVPIDGAAVVGGNGTSTTTTSSGSSSNSTTSASGESSSVASSTSSSGSNGTSTTGNGSSTSSSAGSSATYEGASTSLSVPGNTLALSAVLGLVACGFAAWV